MKDLFSNKKTLKDLIIELFKLYDNVGFVGREDLYQRIKVLKKEILEMLEKGER